MKIPISKIIMIEINNTTKKTIKRARIKMIATEFLRAYKKADHDLSVAFIDTAAMKRLNLKYRRKAAATDVLSFPGSGKYLGEVVINPEEAWQTGKVLGINSQAKSLEFLLVHGLLHLVAYDDRTESERQKMLSLGKKFLERI